jgi:hypothetical protein
MDNTKIEMKYIEDALYAEKSSTPRKFSKNITLMNSKGTNTHVGLPENYADFILVVGKRGGAIIDKQTLSNYIQINGDSISAVIPTEQMIFIFTPETVEINTQNTINLKQTILDSIKDTLSKF